MTSAEEQSEIPALRRADWQGARDAARPRAEVAAEKVAALAAHVEPGTRLGTKEELRALCGVSVGTFNEALRLLQSREVITMRSGPGGGLFAAESTAWLGDAAVILDSARASVADAVRLRNALDPLLIEDALWHGSPADFADLREHLASMGKATEAGDAVAFVRANWRLHARLADISPSHWLRSIYTKLIEIIESHTIEVVAAGDAPLPDYIRQRHALHADLVAALERRDADEAMRLIAAHNTTPSTGP
ncbi:transcriptional regulator NanR [Actinomadura rubteroloni]|uniref:Transcriptional regulator NanR n=1 Tax=Actinomadura rubteroloni TaxID=1926885 RepID=A0A2P4UDU4_9ACTN|nr:GntR family transcriptional regulator [Actinomadura rubteroloni]POM23192.1 transcriptional regulator NanR [Actinomadura rubteroloni]